MQSNEELAAIYHETVASLTLGLICYTEARLLFDQLAHRLVAVNTGSLEEIALPQPLTLRTPYRDFDNWHYLSAAGFFVYSTTLLDTFLSETAAFLFTFRPKALGTDSSVSISDIVTADSKYSVINEAVERRVRAMGFETFMNRLRTFDRVFGLRLGLTSREIEILEACTEGRNAFIHDQGLYRIGLNKNGDIEISSKACPVHTRDIPRAVMDAAVGLLTKICSGLYLKVIGEVLNVNDSKYRDTAAWIERMGQLLAEPLKTLAQGETSYDDRGLLAGLDKKWIPLTREAEQSGK